MERVERFVEELKVGSIENPVSQAECMKTGEPFRESCLAIGEPEESFDESCLAVGEAFTESCMAVGDACSGSCIALGSPDKSCKSLGE